MSDLSFNELRRANVKRCGESFHPLDSWSPTDWATALAGECGEACNFVKKLRRLGDNLPQDTLSKSEIITNIACELADTIIYADLLAARLSISLETAVKAKFNIVSDRVNSDIRL